MERMLRGTTTWGNHLLVCEGLRTLRVGKTTLDRRAGVLTLVHLSEEADSRVVLVFRANETLAVQVLNFVAGVTTVILANVRGEIVDVSFADRRGTWPIIVLRVRGISLLINHLQSPYSSF